MQEIYTQPRQLGSPGIEQDRLVRRDKHNQQRRLRSCSHSHHLAGMGLPQSAVPLIWPLCG